ncbi:MAG: aminoacyl--tRNA ligase-related protein [Patescibacteria group bacterium]
MLYSKLFGKTSKSAPHDADSVNARFLAQGGFVDQVMAGVFTWLPLGLRVLRKVENIVREEMDALGAEEILMPALEPKENWEKSGRWQTVGILYKIKSRDGRELALGPTHEEIVTPLVGKFVKSYKDLPVALYQIQTKFRDEPRAKSGVLRGREFEMKDLYSFHADEADLEKYYPQVVKAYLKIFKRLGIKAEITSALGGSFSPTSDEFQLIAESGEDKLSYCANDKKYFNQELTGDKTVCPLCGGELKKEVRGIEIGNTFKLKYKFADAFNVQYTDKDGKRQKVVMGCYGIGVSRLVGAIVEASHDDRGIIWPKSVAPYLVHLVILGGRPSPTLTKAAPNSPPLGARTPSERGARGRGGVYKAAMKIYDDLTKSGVEVLCDDRDVSPGEKFGDADLIGAPLRLVVSEKTLAKKSVEWKERKSEAIKLVKISSLKKELAKYCKV